MILCSNDDQVAMPRNVGTNCKIDKTWEKHGWWIVEEDPSKPYLWMTHQPFKIRDRTSALGKRFGEIQAITTRPSSDMIYVMCVPDADEAMQKTSLSRQLLLASIPESLLASSGSVKFLNTLQKFWLNIAPAVRTARQEHMSHCLGLSQEDVARAMVLMDAHIKYEALLEADPTHATSQGPPAEPEETDPIHRSYVIGGELDYQPLQQIAQSVPVQRIATTEPPVGSAPLSGRGRPSKRPRRERGDIASGSGGRSSNVATSGARSTGRGSRARGRGSGSTTMRFPAQHGASAYVPSSSLNVSAVEDEFQEVSDQDEEDSESEPRMALEASTSSKFLAPIPTEAEIAKGSLWGDIVFEVKIDKIIQVESPLTNHRVLSAKRVREVYDFMRHPENKTCVSKLVLRPIKYIVDVTTDDGVVRREEVSFPLERAQREFQRIFDTHGLASIHGTTHSQLCWLQERIIWEPVDGQHIVAACNFAKEEVAQHKLSHAEFINIFEMREATFVVYDDPALYLAKSARVNKKEWNRTKYSTMDEDLRKLREIWELYGKPDSLVRADDERRAKALVCAANAVQKNLVEGNKGITIKRLAKQMHDLTIHAWNPRRECYEAILQVCKDYEDGHLFYSKEEEKKWKAFADKNNLDPTVDVREHRKRMTMYWLRPLNVVPQSAYLRLVKSCAAKPVGEDSRRPRQSYYFHAIKDASRDPRTIAGAVDRIMRQEAVANITRWLMVSNKECSPNSMEEFFHISVRKYFPGGKEQIDAFGKDLAKDTKAAWAKPTREKVSKLADISELIPTSIKVHYQDIATRTHGEVEASADEGGATTVTWKWVLQVQRPTQTSTPDHLMVRARGGLFHPDVQQLTQSYLWVVDCRRGGGRHGDGPWEEEQFTKVIAQLSAWMTGVERWNSILLLPPAVFANAELFAKLKLPEGGTQRHGCWAFGANSVDQYALNFTQGGQLQQAVEPFGGVVVYMQHPVDTSPNQNYVSGDRPLPLVFHDQWSETHQPSEGDRLERSPSELSRLVDAYLPIGWGLAAYNITTAIPTILHGGFHGSEIIVIDDSLERLNFLYTKLFVNFQGQLQIPEMTGATRSTSVGISEGEDPMNIGSEEGGSDEDELGDEADTSIPAPYTLANVRQPREYDTDVPSPDHNSCDDGLHSSVEPNGFEEGSEIPEVVLDTPIQTRPMVPSIPQSTESADTIAFNEAFAPMMTFRDGFYYNTDGIRYTRHGEPGSYTYEESASISLQDSIDPPVSLAAVDRMVHEAYEGSTGRTMEEDD